MTSCAGSLFRGAPRPSSGGRDGLACSFARTGAEMLHPHVVSINLFPGWGPPITAARLMTPARRYTSVGACLNSSVCNWFGYLRCSKEWPHETCMQCAARFFGHVRDPRVSARSLSLVVGVL